MKYFYVCRMFRLTSTIFPHNLRHSILSHLISSYLWDVQSAVTAVTLQRILISDIRGTNLPRTLSFFVDGERTFDLYLHIEEYHNDHLFRKVVTFLLNSIENVLDLSIFPKLTGFWWEWWLISLEYLNMEEFDICIFPFSCW